MKYQISFFNQFKGAHFIGFVTLFVVLLMWMLNFEPTAVRILSLSLLVFFSPVIFLHVEYLIEDWGKIVIIDKARIRVFKNNKLIDEYDFEQIDKVLFYKSYILDETRVVHFATEYYYYIKIFFTDKKSLVITSLSTNEKFEAFCFSTAEKIKPRYTAFASLSYPLVFNDGLR